MLGRENTGSALGSGAVDASFWALVCEDKEWLDAEFDAIVSEASESPTSSTGRANRIDISWEVSGERRDRPSGTARPWRTGNRPGGRWRRERGPPRSAWGSTGEAS